MSAQEQLEEKIKKIAQSIKDNKQSITTEEATKHSFVMPFLKALGYDVFDPNIVVPEFIADIGRKKGEKVDYAIMQDEKPLVLIEVKNHKETLDSHKTQLERYFNAEKRAKFAILTNGIEYRFFTDTNNPNIMDKTPFFAINLSKLKKGDCEYLAKFAKDCLDIEEITKTAQNKLYHQQIQRIFKE